MSALALSLLSVSVSAQESAASKNDSESSARKSGKMHKDKKAELNLTDEQKKAMQENREQFRTKMQAIENDQSLSAADKAEKLAALKADQKASTGDLLTDDQKATIARKKAANEGERKMRSEKRLANIKTELNLTDEQMTQWSAIDVSTHAKIKALRNDASLDDNARKAQIESIRKSAEERRDSILTPEQLKKKNQMKATKKHKRPKHV